MNAAANGTLPPLSAASLAAMSRDDKHTLLGDLLRDLFGDDPQGETVVRNADNGVYMHLMPPLARAKLFVTPERLTRWKADLQGECRPLSELNALLARGDEAEIRAYAESLKK